MTQADTTFRAACVQLRAGVSRHENLKTALQLIADAAAAGAAFIATPEMTNVLDRKPARLFSDLPTEDALDEIPAFAEAARRHGVWLLIGSMAVRTGEGRAANRSYLFSPKGEVAATYDKVHRFDVDLPGGESWKESNVYDAGDCAVVAQTPLANFGMTICYDVRFPTLFRRLSQAGANVLCVPAAFTRQTGEAHWKTLLTARAIENGAFVIAPAQGGLHEDGRETYGHSLMIGPWGEILAEKADNAPGIVVAAIDPAKSAEARQRIPNLALESDYKISIVKQ